MTTRAQTHDGPARASIADKFDRYGARAGDVTAKAQTLVGPARAPLRVGSDPYLWRGVP